ncbi:MAG: bifunctional (p)ppGpp synthetase/guanosine-3',5'-bis(diphosphate) 3'-pyrophosphohydrolase [Bacteroidia bacterium]|nr:bifunctional (p)ppGpp synthetase/guanosine-3',5'-bis(diphosphate) 3'-pyrophosphohydrolase [Bacteroidia bacterium]
MAVTAKIIDADRERKEILSRYKAVLRACKPNIAKSDKKLIRHAFNIANEAHVEMRRKSGEPYIYHPLAVAEIAGKEIGLGTTSIICSLLHDTVEDTDVTLDDIQHEFGKKVSDIIDGLTKIDSLFDHKTDSIQAENFRKMLLTMADDVRVMLIKLADRLHNMRTLDAMRRDKQLKIASETKYIYAPLAHRLGLYAIKTELEDLSMKYTEPEMYRSIAKKLQTSKAQRNRYIRTFTEPLKKELKDSGLTYTILGRPKAINSIWSKMKKQKVSFEKVFDLFAIRIVIDTEPKYEKADCWKAYSIVTDFYRPNPDRLRDWISNPKVNGYEALHTTVMGPKGRWVEIQIRTERMDAIAEKGLAAHWKYKETNADTSLDNWLAKVKDLLQSPEANAMDFVDDFKLNLFAEEIYVFTPAGQLKKLPVNATALDFAFDIHTDIGINCIGAKVNHKLVPLSHRLNNGDQIEIITSKKQKPKDEWLNYVVTAKAKSRIKSSLKDEKRSQAEFGKAKLERKFKQRKLKINESNINILLSYFKVTSPLDLYYNIETGKIDLKKLDEFETKGDLLKPSRSSIERKESSESTTSSTKRKKSELLLIGDDLDKIDYKIANCCNPIPGDDVFGFVTVDQGIKIHRVSCPNTVELMSNYAYRIVKAKWTNQKEIVFLTGLRITGIDDVGIINNITKVISRELKVNIRAINVDSLDGIFEGTILLFVNDTKHLDILIKDLKKIKGILTIDRLSPDEYYSAS